MQSDGLVIWEICPIQFQFLFHKGFLSKLKLCAHAQQKKGELAFIQLAPFLTF